ncbi:MAG: RsmE family RNA methyltransferase [Bacteroidetes bacterium]|nr:RsmE family RNA methyltransferase [Bacteroidota bacterium]
MQEEFFYTDNKNIFSDNLFLESDEANHISRVLRKSIGELIWVVNGSGVAIKSEITKIDKSKIECKIISTHLNCNEAELEITLAFALLKNPSRVDFIIEKCTELGGFSFQPFISNRTISKNDKIKRWQQIALSSMKQSSRCRLPLIKNCIDYNELISTSENFDLKIIPHEKTDQLKNINELFLSSKNYKKILIAIGPEGGFTDNEIESAVKNNFKTISLGLRRLRSETAAITAVAKIIK